MTHSASSGIGALMKSQAKMVSLRALRTIFSILDFIDYARGRETLD